MKEESCQIIRKMSRNNTNKTTKGRFAIIIAISVFLITLYTSCAFGAIDPDLPIYDITCTATSADINSDATSLSYRWYEVQNDGTLSQISTSNAIQVQDLESKVYVCEVFANDGFENSLLRRKAYTLANDKMYIPYGSMESELIRFAGYYGRDSIPKTSEADFKTNIEYEVNSVCYFGECGFFVTTTTFESKYLALVFETFARTEFKVDNMDKFVTSVDSVVVSEFPRVNSDTINPYFVSSQGFLSNPNRDEAIDTSQYLADFDIVATVYLIDGSSYDKRGSLSLENNVLNVTFNVEVVIRDRYGVNPPYIIPGNSATTFVTHNGTVIDLAPGHSNVFIPGSYGTTNITATVDFDALVQMDVSPARTSEDILVFNGATCPKSLRLQGATPWNIFTQNTTDYLPVDGTLVYMDDRNVEHALDFKSSWVSYINNMTSIEGYFTGEGFGDANARAISFFNNFMLYTGVTRNAILNVSNSFNQGTLTGLFDPGSSNYLGNMYKVTYAPRRCDAVSTEVEVNLTNIMPPSPRCIYGISNFGEYHKTFYWRGDSWKLEVFQNCDGVNTSVDKSRLTLVQASGSVNFLESNSGVCTNTVQADGIATDCFTPISLGPHKVDVYVDGDYKFSVTGDTECPYLENSIDSEDDELTANSVSRTILMGDSFDLDEVVIKCRGDSDGNSVCLDGSDVVINMRTMLEHIGDNNFKLLQYSDVSVGTNTKLSANVQSAKVNMSVLDCSLGGSSVEDFTLSFNGNNRGFCAAPIENTLQFVLPAPHFRDTRCSDVDEGVTSTFTSSFIRSHAYVATNETNFGQDIPANADEVVSSIVAVLEDSRYTDYIANSIIPYFNNSAAQNSLFDSTNGLIGGNFTQITALRNSNRVLRPEPLRLQISAQNPYHLAEIAKSYGGPKQIFIDDMSKLMSSALQAVCTDHFGKYTNVSRSIDGVESCYDIIAALTFDPGAYIVDTGSSPRTVFCDVELDSSDVMCCERGSDCVYEGTCYGHNNVFDIDIDKVTEVCLYDN